MKTKVNGNRRNGRFVLMTNCIKIFPRYIYIGLRALRRIREKVHFAPSKRTLLTDHDAKKKSAHPRWRNPPKQGLRKKKKKERKCVTGPKCIAVKAIYMLGEVYSTTHLKIMQRI